MFNHLNMNLPELTTKTVNRKRYYVTPQGNQYPSITTVLSNRNKKGLMEWRKRVGNDVATILVQSLQLEELMYILCVRIT